MAALATLACGVPRPLDAAKSEAAQGPDDVLKSAREFLSRVDKQYAEWNNKQSIAEWNYASDLTPSNLAIKLNVSSEAARFYKSIWKEVNEFPRKDEIKDENVKRQFSKLSVLGAAALPEDVRN